MSKNFPRYFILFLISWLISFLVNLTVFSDNKEIIWQKTYGGIKSDISAEIIYSRENYLLVVGETNSWGAGNSDAWILKLDQEGNIIWDKTYGDKGNDGAYSIVETEDDGYLICGYTWSKDRKDDGWIFKIDRNGNKIWEKMIGGYSFDKLFSIFKDRDNNYVAVGRTNSWGAGNSDAWILKLDQEGNIIWDKTYGDKGNDGAYSIVETEDDGYLICGYTWSKDRKDDGWIFKIDRNGRMIWQQSYGDITGDRLTSVIRSKDQSYIAVGFADRDSCPLCREQGYVWIINLSAEGQKAWERKFGGSVYDMANQVIQSPEAYILVGRAKLKYSETYSAWLLKVDNKGNILDNLVITNNKDNYFKSIVENKKEGDFFILGDTWFEGVGSSDIWLLKVSI